MNKTNIVQRLRRPFSALAIIGALAVGALFALPTAEAGKPSDTSYGPGALYQIELSLGDNGTDHGQGGGIWLWIALYPNGTGDYAGSDCIEQGGRYGIHGAYPDQGDVTWTYANNCSPGEGCDLVISGVLINGWAAFGFDPNTTITVPSLYGHYAGTLGTFLTLIPVLDPNGGQSVLQVAP